MLSGCVSGPTPEEEIYETLEHVVSVEKDFEKQQDPLVDLEKKEKEIYDQLISLSMNDYDKIVNLADEALSIVDEREEHLQNEKESINKSKEEVEKVDSIIKEIKDADLKQEVSDLINVMEERYTSYDKLFESYSNALQLDRSLYEMFKNKDLTLEELEDQINKINDMYEQV